LISLSFSYLPISPGQLSKILQLLQACFYPDILAYKLHIDNLTDFINFLFQKKLRGFEKFI